MQIKLIDFTEELKRYMEQYTEESAEELWDQIVLGEKWTELCVYSPVDLDNRKPKAIHDIETLKVQTDLLAKIDRTRLQQFFDKVASVLPNYDDDPITAALIPSDPANRTVNELQNGVLGTSLFGNILIQVNPLIEGFESWIKYVFAHEYHHTVWGNYWFNFHGAELKNDLLQALTIDGQADSFAMSLIPGLKPKWLYSDQEAFIEKLYHEKYKAELTSTDFDYVSLMFGNDEQGIPWCGGYAVGYFLLQKYIQRGNTDFKKLIETRITEKDLI